MMKRVAQSSEPEKFLVAPVLSVDPTLQPVPVLKKTVGFGDGERYRRRIQDFRGQSERPIAGGLRQLVTIHPGDERRRGGGRANRVRFGVVQGDFGASGFVVRFDVKQ